MIDKKSVVVTAKDKRYSNLNQDTVILDLKSEEYYGLNHVGSTVWRLLQKPVAVEEIQELILSKYDVGAEECFRDLKAFLENLEAQELIKVLEPASV